MLTSHLRIIEIGKGKGYILVGDDLHTLDMTGGLEDLLQDILGHPWIKSSNVQSSLVWLGGGPAYISTSTGRGHHVPGHRGRDSGWNRIGVLWNHNRRTRRGWHMGRIGLAVALRRIILLTRSR